MVESSATLSSRPLQKAGRQARQQGVAMLLVLMITAVMAVVVTVYQYKNRLILDQAQLAKDHMQARALLESVKEELLFNLSTTTLWLQGPNAEQLSELNMPASLNFRGEVFTWKDVNISITDASGLIPLTPFNSKLWHSLLAWHQVPEPMHVVAAMEDWFDNDEFVRLNGAEAADYSQPDYPRNGLPQALSELSLIKGLAPYWHKLASHLTFIGDPVVNYEFSPDTLLPVLLGEYRAEKMIELRQQGSGKDQAQQDLMIEQNEEMNIYPGIRLRITMSVQKADAAYQQSFTLLRGRFAKRLTYIADKQPGYLLDPAFLRQTQQQRAQEAQDLSETKGLPETQGGVAN
jgi:type II secretory pathway component PulK